MYDENRHSAVLDDRLLDRLVDGELSADQRQQVLEAVTKEPDGWRRCALAFLQSQLLSEALCGIDDTTDQSMHGACTAAAGQAPDGEAVPGKVCRGEAGGTQGTSAWRLLALAASLLLAFAAGYRVHRFGGETVDRRASHLASSEAQSPGLAQSQEMTDGADRGGVAAEGFGDPQLGEIRDEIPVAATFLDTTPLDEYWKNPSAVPQVVKEQLQSLGMDIRQQRGFMPLRSQDGRHFVVPYEDIRILPVSDLAY